LGDDGEPKNLKKTAFWRPKPPKNFKKKQKNDVDVTKNISKIRCCPGLQAS
jgi:hypothetical protein